MQGYGAQVSPFAAQSLKQADEEQGVAEQLQQEAASHQLSSLPSENA